MSKISLSRPITCILMAMKSGQSATLRERRWLLALLKWKQIGWEEDSVSKMDMDEREMGKNLSAEETSISISKEPVGQQWSSAAAEKLV